MTSPTAYRPVLIEVTSITIVSFVEIVPFLWQTLELLSKV